MGIVYLDETLKESIQKIALHLKKTDLGDSIIKKIDDELELAANNAKAWEGNPPRALIDYGLLVELDEGMWLHEALRERFLREVGKIASKRKRNIEN